MVCSSRGGGPTATLTLTFAPAGEKLIQPALSCQWPRCSVHRKRARIWDRVAIFKNQPHKRPGDKKDPKALFPNRHSAFSCCKESPGNCITRAESFGQQGCKVHQRALMGSVKVGCPSPKVKLKLPKGPMPAIQRKGNVVSIAGTPGQLSRGKQLQQSPRSD